ncbi:MAG: hypothetical protein AAB676_22015 [Verrucomicrobiota bacterium]
MKLPFLLPVIPVAADVRRLNAISGIIRHLALAGVLVLFLAAGPAELAAQLPIVRLSTIFPPGGQLGTTFEMSATGADLDEALQIHFSHAGLAAKPKVAASTGQADPNKFLVTISSNTPPGIYDVRLVGRFGISNPRAFAVGILPETAAKQPNHTPETAAEISLESTVNAHAEANAVDFFKFTAKKEQRVLIECQAKDIDSRMDPVLVLLDASGKELERNRRGGLLDFTAVADGPFLLKVHDHLYRGGEDYFYRLSLSMGPHIDFIFPPAGLPGTKSQYVLYGHNLPGGAPAQQWMMDGKPLDQLTVEIELPDEPLAKQRLASLAKPVSSVLDGIEYRLQAGPRVSNPVLLSFAAAPVVPEQEPNGKPSEAQKIALPCEYAGHFFPPGDQDWVAFDAKKGEVYWLEVLSQRLGWPTDPFVLVQRVAKNSEGAEQVSDVKELYDADANIGGVEFNTATRDPVWRFEVNDDGAYRVQIRDLFQHASRNPPGLYRLSIRKATPDFRLVALPLPPPPINKDAKVATVWTPFLRWGETLPIKVIAFRRDDFSGEIRLSIEGLPLGVICSDGRIETGQNAGVLLLTAAETAAPWTGAVKVVGKARIGGTEVAREARGGTVTWNVADYTVEPIQSRLTSEFVLGVSGHESAPLLIAPGESKVWETSLAGKLPVPVKLVRRGDFNAGVKLKPAGLAALESMKEIDVDGKATNATLEFDLTQLKIPVGLHSFFLQAETQGKYRNNPEAAQATEDAAKQAEKAASELAAEAKKAADALATAAKAAGEAEALAKAAADKLAAAKTAAEKTSGNAELTAAQTAAEKEAGAALEKAQAAATAKAAAEKAANDLAAQAKEAEARKAATAQLAKEATEKAKPRDVAIVAYSTPFQLKITPAPITLAAKDPAGPLHPGGKAEISVTINRLYNFSDPVELNLIVPNDAKGISAAKLVIPKDQTQAALIVEAAADATLGEHKATLQAALKLNNQDLKIDQSILLKVAAKDAAKSP